MRMKLQPRGLGLVFGVLLSTGLTVACGDGGDSGTESSSDNGGAGTNESSGGSAGIVGVGGSPEASGGSPSDSGGAGTGGSVARGGTTGSGGAITSGGAVGRGGASTSGGMPGNGGAIETTGGTVENGGAMSLGGSPGAGGEQTNGGSEDPVGGTLSAGGTQDSGGTEDSGGAEAAGGLEEAGGEQTSGGAETAGGAEQAGGAETSGGSPGNGGGPSNCTIPAPSNTPIGYGARTTGGGNATPVTVSSFDEAVAALDNYRDAFGDGTANALVVRYTGTFDYGTITDVCAQHSKDAQILYIKEVENVTFEGAPGSSANFGIKVNRAKNVIIRNMTMGLLPGGGDSDAITLEGNGTNGDVENIWVDHNDLFSSTKDDCDGAGDTEFDGLIDIKKGARYITISHNYLHDHQKTGLLGSSDDENTERYVTFHHNWYQNVVSRTPLQRFGYTHLFNNYYNQITSSGINVRMGGVALIEKNYFENAMNPVTSRYSEEAGFWDLRDNYVGEGITWNTEEDTLANADTWETTREFPASELDYSYTPDPAECVKEIVMATAGANL